MTRVKKLIWDSDFFGIPIASITSDSAADIEKELSKLREKEIELVYVFLAEHSEPLKPGLLSHFNGILVDRKVTYSMKIARKTPQTNHPNIKINFYQKENERLIQLAILAGTYSRFNIDPNIKSSKFHALYCEWIKRSVKGEFADYLLSYHTKNDPYPLGFATLTINQNRGRIGLISALASAQNSGLGTSLIQNAIALCIRNKVEVIDVITQKDNKPACKFYLKNGFHKMSTQNIYHFWLKK